MLVAEVTTMEVSPADFAPLKVVAATLALPLAALLWDAGEARHVYLLAAVFHGWLELGVFLAMGLGLRGFGPQGAREAPSALAAPARAATP
jgi:hypothetical protein